MTDQELVRKILKGDQQAVNQFYRQYREKLLALISQKVDGQVAEEIGQDTFLSALDSLPLFAGRSSLYTWLVGIARHEIADYYRRKKLKEVVFSRIPFLKKIVSQALSPEMALEEKELKEKIKKSFGSLSEGYRQILRLRYVDGYHVSDLAKRLGVSYKSAESKLFRARVAFQKVFAESKGNYQNRNLASSS